MPVQNCFLFVNTDDIYKQMWVFKLQRNVFNMLRKYFSELGHPRIHLKERET